MNSHCWSLEATCGLTGAGHCARALGLGEPDKQAAPRSEWLHGASRVSAIGHPRALTNCSAFSSPVAERIAPEFGRRRGKPERIRQFP